MDVAADLQASLSLGAHNRVICVRHLKIGRIYQPRRFGDLKLFEPIIICSIVTLCDREERYPAVARLDRGR